MSANIVLLVRAEDWAHLCHAVNMLERARLEGWQPEIDAVSYVVAGVAQHFKQRVQCSSRVEQS